MAGVSTEQGDKHNVDLNLVPFIDLLSTLVLFLLVTAVWLQISAIPASVEANKKGQATTADKPQDRLQVRVTAHSLRLTWPESVVKLGALPSVIQKNKESYEYDRLIEVLKMVAERKALSAASVSSDDDVPYGFVVQTIDTIKQGGFTTVGLSTE